jgi:thiamine biosynthesis lipoprotein
MRRRTFVTASLLTAAGAASTAWWAWPRPSGARGGAHHVGGQPLPDGRMLVRSEGRAFGTSVSIVAAHDDPERARRATAAALDQIRRVDALMTVYRPQSQVSRLNASGELRDPDPHVVRVVEFSQHLANLSGGAFDVTVQPLWQLYEQSRRLGRLPSSEAVTAARSRVDWTALAVSSRRITLGRRGMAITLNGIAQGYAADLALASLREFAIEDALIDAGEFAAEGMRQPGQPWTVGIRHPRDADAVIAAIAMDGRFLATSGDYEAKFSDDYLDHHIFDPRTGHSPRALSSVAVAARTGMEADGLTKPMMVLELASAQALLASFPGSGALWIDKQSRVVASQDLPLSTWR